MVGGSGLRQGSVQGVEGKRRKYSRASAEVGREGHVASLASLGKREVRAPFDVPLELSPHVDDARLEVEVLFGESEGFTLTESQPDTQVDGDPVALLEACPDGVDDVTSPGLGLLLGGARRFVPSAWLGHQLVVAGPGVEDLVVDGQQGAVQDHERLGAGDAHRLARVGARAAGTSTASRM